MILPSEAEENAKPFNRPDIWAKEHQGISDLKELSELKGKLEDLKKECARLREALGKIVKDGCGAINYRGAMVDTFCVKTAKEALSKRDRTGTE